MSNIINFKGYNITYNDIDNYFNEMKNNIKALKMNGFVN